MKRNESEKLDPEYIGLLARGLIKILVLLALMFMAAGRLDYWQGWVFSAIVLSHVAIAAIMFADRPDLAKERVRPGPGMKWWDKIFLVLIALSASAILVLGPLDAGRFGWTGPLPLSVYFTSYLLYLVSSSLTLWAMWTNRFFSSVVRIQSDRGQVVVESGPYRFVRHPGYVGGILLFVALPLMLGSIWALVPASLAIVLLIVRTHLEDHTLQQELAGYEAYAEQVRYRLLPRIW